MDDLDPILPRPERTPDGTPDLPDRPESARHGIGHQAPDAADLQRHPPAGERCSWVRARLRDHADGDLEVRIRQTVDEHVHGCRDCALALSRAELEVVRIRKALREERAALADVPADLTKNVLAAVGRTVVVGRDTPADFTQMVMERVRREWRRPSWRRRVVERVGRGPLMAAAAAVIVALTAIVATALLEGHHAQERRFEVARVDGPVWIKSERGERPVRAGEALTAGTRVRAARGAAIELQLRDPELERSAVARPGGGEPLARLVLDGAGEVSIGAAGGFGVGSGAVQLQTDSALAVALDGIAGVDVAPGRYDLSLLTVRRFDGGPSAGGTRRARVAVQAGEARIRRGAAAPVVVTVGRVARFDAASRIDVDIALDDALLERSRRAGRDLPTADAAGERVDAPSSFDWMCRVLDGRTGKGVPDAEVHVVLSGGRSSRHPTDSEGRFGFNAEVAEGEVAVIEVTPPAKSGLAAFGPLPRRLDLAVQARRELAPVVLSADVPVRGTVWTADHTLVAGAEVVPCLVDEAFGMLERYEALATTTGIDGRFELRGLPHGLAAHQALTLLVSAPGHATTASIALGRRLEPTLETPLEVELGELASVQIAGLEPNAEYPAVAGGPRSAGGRVHRVDVGLRGRQGAGRGARHRAGSALGRARGCPAAAGAGRRGCGVASGHRAGERALRDDRVARGDPAPGRQEARPERDGARRQPVRADLGSRRSRRGAVPRDRRPDPRGAAAHAGVRRTAGWRRRLPRFVERQRDGGGRRRAAAAAARVRDR